MAARYFTAEEANEALADVRPLAEEMVERRRTLAELQVRQVEFTDKVAGNGGDFDPGELRDVFDRMGEEATAVARCVARIHELGALVKDLDEGSSTSRRSDRARRSSSAGTWAKKTWRTGTASKRALAGGSRSRSNS